MTHYRNLFDAGKYLGAWHLPVATDAVIEIESCTGGVLENGKVKTKKPVIKMVAKTLLFALNKTNAKTIASLYGPDVDAWKGKRIALYVGETRHPDTGLMGPCVRVRPKAPGVGSKGGAIDEAATEPKAEAAP